MIFYDSSKLPKDKEQRHGQCCPAYVKLDIRTQNDFYSIEKFLGGISLLFKRIINNRECQSIFSRSTIRKLFNLLNIQSIDCKNHLRLLKAIHSLAEYICIDFIVHYETPQQLIKNIQSKIGLQDDQFIEPDSNMTEKIIKSILLIDKHHRVLSYKHLAYDSQIIEIAFNNGINISPVQLSLLLYSDIEHELTIEIIRKNFAIPDTFTKSVVKLLEILKQADVERKDLSDFEKKFKFLSTIYLNINEPNDLSWTKIGFVLDKFQEGLKCLPYFHQQQLATNLTNDDQSNDLLLTKGISLTLY
ncbi:unnamed protein product [Rotaria sp. Silwood2]|nr:unnamed protein product [Rotaria sp. Silwood2]